LRANILSLFSRQFYHNICPTSADQRQYRTENCFRRWGLAVDFTKAPLLFLKLHAIEMLTVFFAQAHNTDNIDKLRMLSQEIRWKVTRFRRLIFQPQQLLRQQQQREQQQRQQKRATGYGAGRLSVLLYVLKSDRIARCRPRHLLTGSEVNGPDNRL
jgi:hypothetical protein